VTARRPCSPAAHTPPALRPESVGKPAGELRKRVGRLVLRCEQARERD